MTRSIMQSYGVEDPAPHSDEVHSGVLFGALLAAPLAWLLQLSMNYGLASETCFPREYLRPAPGLPWLGSGVLAINLVALAVAVAAAIVSFLVWRRLNEEAAGGHGRLIHAGEGRTRFLAVWGIWSGLWFAIQIAFNTIAGVGVPPCAS